MNIAGTLRALFCAPGGIYRPEFLKLNLTMTARQYPGQWSMCGSLCPYESVTPKPCSWGSLLPGGVARLGGEEGGRRERGGYMPHPHLPTLTPVFSNEDFATKFGRGLQICSSDY